MFNWFQKTIRSSGIVYFPGVEPLRGEDFQYLTAAGIELQPAKQKTDDAWAFDMSHRDWGRASVECPRELLESPEIAVRFSPVVTAQEKADSRLARRGLLVTMESERQNVLQDRKNLLRYLQALMGTKGVISLDATSQLPWTRST